MRKHMKKKRKENYNLTIKVAVLNGLSYFRKDSNDICSGRGNKMSSDQRGKKEI